jgi:hypothetical protein
MSGVEPQISAIRGPELINLRQELHNMSDVTGEGASLELSQMVSGRGWWVYQFGIISNGFWQRLVGVPVWNNLKWFLAEVGGCASLE